MTMASLALGWIGKPAQAHLIQPTFVAAGISSPAVLHSTAFGVAFSLIPALHIVIGEQVPKLYALRWPGATFLRGALPLKAFYPFMVLLNSATNTILKRVRIGETEMHAPPLCEEEIGASLTRAHQRGALTNEAYELLTAVFELEETLCREIMVPRGEIEFLELEQPFSENLNAARRASHPRLPLYEGPSIGWSRSSTQKIW